MSPALILLLIGTLIAAIGFIIITLIAIKADSRHK